jgi:hypothetical protein
MTMSGSIVVEKLLAAVNRQVASIAPCAALIRKTDAVVGSLNLQVDITKTGPSLDVQSDASQEAKQCLYDGMKTWSLAGAGYGRAMVLLSLERSPTRAAGASGHWARSTPWATSGEHFRALGEHTCHSRRSNGHSCIVELEGDGACAIVESLMRQQDCCPTTEEGGRSAGFHLESCLSEGHAPATTK